MKPVNTWATGGLLILTLPKPATMVPMICRSLFRISLIAAGIGLVVSALAANAQDASQRGRKYKSPPPTARIEVTVLRDVNAAHCHPEATRR